MEKAIPKAISPIGKLICAAAIGHNFIETKKINDVISEYRCSCCAHEVTDNVNGLIEKLTPKMKEINSCLSEFIKKKLKRTA
jgi:hypothetical protein